MGKVVFLAAVLCSVSVASASAAISVPSHYLDQQRCLAVLNVANAAFATAEPSAFKPGTRERVAREYDSMRAAIASWTTLTPQQVDKGLDHFEAELDHWLAAFGDANEDDMNLVFFDALFKRVEACKVIGGPLGSSVAGR